MDKTGGTEDCLLDLFEGWKQNSRKLKDYFDGFYEKVLASFKDKRFEVYNFLTLLFLSILI